MVVAMDKRLLSLLLKWRLKVWHPGPGYLLPSPHDRH